MEEIVIILVKINIALAILTSFYWVFLRKFTFYQLNRYYLLFTVIFSIFYPLIGSVGNASKIERLLNAVHLNAHKAYIGIQDSGERLEDVIHRWQHPA